MGGRGNGRALIVEETNCETVEEKGLGDGGGSGGELIEKQPAASGEK